MGYLMVAGALLAGVTKGYCGKKTSADVSETRDASFINLVRMVICVVIGFLALVLQGAVTELAVDRTVLLVSLLSGLTNAVFVVTWLVSVKKGAYMMIDVFLMMGVIVTLLCSYFAYGERILPIQWLGIAMIVSAVLILCSYNNKIKEKITPSAVIVLIVCGLSSGICDFSSKIFTHYVNENRLTVPTAVFNFYTYVFAAFFLFLFYLTAKKTSDGTNRPLKLLKRIFVYVLVMSVCLFANAYCKTQANYYLDPVLLYPVCQGGALILSSMMAHFIFGEKLTARGIIGIVIAFLSLVTINILPKVI